MTATTTSIEAWDEVRESTVGLRMRVLRLLREFGPCTATELAARSGERPSIQKRLNELVTEGAAERLEARACAVTGKRATVWGAKDCRASQGQHRAPLAEMVTGPKLGESDAHPAAAGGQRNHPRFSPSSGQLEFRDESARATGQVLTPTELVAAPGVRPVVCACGCASGVTCGCGVTYCAAPGHARHECEVAP